MNRKLTHVGLLLAAWLVLAGGSVFAQRRGRCQGPRRCLIDFYLGEVYRGHAGDHAFLLNQYSATGTPVPIDVIQEHAAAVRANIEAAQKSYGKISAGAKKTPVPARR